ncbi:MAG: hypothetical protein ACTSR8_21760 [Promethearchaeota archaeon]
MSRRKSNSKIELSINEKIRILKRVIENVQEILILFRPLMKKMLRMEEAQVMKENGMLSKVAELFGEISDNCKEIEGYPTLAFLKDLAN